MKIFLKKKKKKLQLASLATVNYSIVFWQLASLALKYFAGDDFEHTAQR